MAELRSAGAMGELPSGFAAVLKLKGVRQSRSCGVSGLAGKLTETGEWGGAGRGGGGAKRMTWTH